MFSLPSSLMTESMESRDGRKSVGVQCSCAVQLVLRPMLGRMFRL